MCTHPTSTFADDARFAGRKRTRGRSGTLGIGNAFVGYRVHGAGSGMYCNTQVRAWELAQLAQGSKGRVAKGRKMTGSALVPLAVLTIAIAALAADAYNPPRQTPTQMAKMQAWPREAEKLSAGATPALLAKLGSADFRRAPGGCCPVAAAMSVRSLSTANGQKPRGLALAGCHVASRARRARSRMVARGTSVPGSHLAAFVSRTPRYARISQAVELPCGTRWPRYSAASCGPKNCPSSRFYRL